MCLSCQLWFVAYVDEFVSLFGVVRLNEARMHQKFSTLEDISNEWHIRPSTARNRLALGQNLPPSITVGGRRLIPGN